ncbi:MAG TPA: GNAT family N-acetyltransferase [Thermoplasmata archaeon]|nr:GNAT family N-acetyltransferase [Thermoplasmata archaeon]
MLRQLRWEDFDAIVESYWELYDERDRGEPVGVGLFAERPSREDEAAWFTAVYRRVLAGDEIAVVAEVEGKAVGLCNVHPTFPGGREGDGGHVGELGIMIDHRHRGRGLGRAMIVRALELSRSRFEIVRLWVFANNHGAKHLYAALGFETVGRMPSAVRRGSTYIDLELMYVDLRRWRPPAAAEKG